MLKVPTKHIIFDIDETLAWGFYQDDVSKLIQENPWIGIFRDKKLFLHALKPHIIWPGTIELVQLFQQMPDIKIHFFSSGIAPRNEIFVEKLLSLAFGKDKYDDIKNEIIICSREDLDQGGVRDLAEIQYRKSGISHGNYKKNLKRIIKDDAELEWSVLVEDDSSYCYYSQEKNILQVTGGTYGCFAITYDNSYRNELFVEGGSEHQRVNHIFYLTGILFEAFDIAHQQNITLADALFQIQFREPRENEKESCEKVYNYELWQERKYYESGLQKLQTINPTLDFVTSGNFLTSYIPNV